MNQTVVRVPPGQAAKVFGVVYLILGVVLLPFFLIPVLVGGSPQASGLAFALALPVFYAVVGFLGTALFCWIYNLVASRLGGLQIELTPEPRA